VLDPAAAAIDRVVGHGRVDGLDGDRGSGQCLRPAGAGMLGAVGYTYSIGTYEVTNAQYVEFLNSVAKTDPHEVYQGGMGDTAYPNYGGITRSGDPGSYIYSTIPGRENLPVNHVSFYDALRFVNWLHNGEPDGDQSVGTTEDGAYTITHAGVVNNSIARNPGALFYLPNEHEWYKAAYYDPASNQYLDYPAGSNTETACTPPGATPNQANCYHLSGGNPNQLISVGSYSDSASSYGTFDQGGNVWEWNEAFVSTSDQFRPVRGGAFYNESTYLAASSPLLGVSPTLEEYGIGFRVAPEPDENFLLAAGALALSVLGLAGWRRARA
jgi:formylglycine-generating enzyme